MRSSIQRDMAQIHLGPSDRCRLSEHGRVDGTRAEAIAADLAGPEFLGCDFGEADDGVFGGHVGAVVLEADEAGYGGGVDD